MNSKLSADPPKADQPKKRGSLRRRIWRSVIALVLILFLFLLVGFLWLNWKLRASLANLDGKLEITGLSGEVLVKRDALGIPVIEAGNRKDMALALGFLHGQERFFQMDLMRRQAAGELAELFGPGLIAADKELRTNRFREIARFAIAASPPIERELVEAYASGVNQGIGALDAAPFEYLLLRSKPRLWLAEDTALVIAAMYLDLQGGFSELEKAMGSMRDTLPAALCDFMLPTGSIWDAPIDGGPLAQAPVPGPEILDFRKKSAAEPQKASEPSEEDLERDQSPGSNNWVVAGRLTNYTSGMLASDMHLSHGVPNIWFRASMVIGGGADTTDGTTLTGVTLPGTPLLVAGSNRSVAWGFTNSYGDWRDLVVLEPDPDHGDRYLAPDGPREFEIIEEKIQVKGGPDVPFESRWTIWGPVIGTDHRGRELALHWVAHQPGGIDFSMLAIESARTVEEAIACANGAGIPAQNMAVTDNAGHIAWTIAGKIPVRRGFSGQTPVSWTDGSRGWDGWLDPAAYPRVINPEDGRIWTANARVVGGEMLALVGNGDYALGARAGQIRDRLHEREKFSEKDMLAIQLDDEARFLAPWRDLLLALLDATPKPSDQRLAYREAVANWGGHAAVDSIGYSLVRSFRIAVHKKTFNLFKVGCSRLDPMSIPDTSSLWEESVWQLVQNRPDHLCDPDYANWDQWLESMVQSEIDKVYESSSQLEGRRWGLENVLEIQHPLSFGLPQLGRWLNMPAVGAPGDSNMPRVQRPSFGASQRMVVAPGHEDQGIFQMPGGQSGHPLSPFYRAGHEAWLNGEPSPFLPGPAIHTLRLNPAQAQP